MWCGVVWCVVVWCDYIIDSYDSFQNNDSDFISYSRVIKMKIKKLQFVIKYENKLLDIKDKDNNYFITLQ